MPGMMHEKLDDTETDGWRCGGRPTARQSANSLGTALSAGHARIHATCGPKAAEVSVIVLP